jgi:DNA helicase-2/ATP-dependent DNA helicase PcrA
MGGPGSGKTTLALLKATKRIKDGLLLGQNVLFLSFSRAAVARIVDASKGKIPADQIKTLSIQTFHSFFWKILQGYGYLLGSPRSLSILPAHEEKSMSNGINRDSAEWAAWATSRLEMFYIQGLVCFDLFAPLTAEIMTRSKTIRDRVAKRYPLILVDEAQDTGDEQWECVKLLAERSQVICLADPEQMIYDFLPGVGPARIAQIRVALKPHEVDFGVENNRSPGTEIAAFARDILLGRVKGSGYKGVSRQRYSPSAKERDKAIRSSVGILFKRIKEETGNAPTSVALIASYGNGVAIISSALQKEKPIRHQVLFDEAFTLLASKAAAFLLEPKEQNRTADDIATLLELVGEAFRAKGKQTAHAKWVKCIDYANCCRKGTVPKFKIVVAANTLITTARNRKLTGEPGSDWLTVKNDMRQTGEDSFVEVASSLDYLVAFARGRRIRDNLSEIWMQHGAYIGAREALESALAQEQLISAGEELEGIHVMNMHKCKGKQFDGVVLYRQQHHSPFVWRNEASPQTRSRRLLHMAITRAKSHVLLLDEACSNCSIIDEHTL